MKNILMVLAICLAASCNQTSAHKTTTIPASAPSDPGDSTNMALKKLPLANKKDLVCGMPLRMGLGDTALYNGQIYGFCSKECKEAFVKSPKKYLK